MVPQMPDFQFLYRLDNRRRNQLYALADARQRFQRIQQHCGGRAQKRARFARYDCAVRQFDCRGGLSC